MGRHRKDLPAEATDLPHRYAAILRRRMDRLKLTRAELSARLHALGLAISPHALEIWLRGEGLPKAKGLELVGRALNYRDYRRMLPPPLNQ